MSDNTINCPRCNSEQGFKKKYRAVTGRRWLEVYVRCTMCRWENVLGTTTQEIEDTKAKLVVIAKKRAHEEALHGQSSQSMLDIESRMQQRLKLQERALRQEVDRNGSSSD